MDRTDDLALPAELDATPERQRVPPDDPYHPSVPALRYPPEVIERALYEVAFHAGNTRKAQQALAAGGIQVPYSDDARLGARALPHPLQGDRHQGHRRAARTDRATRWTWPSTWPPARRRRYVRRSRASRTQRCRGLDGAAQPLDVEGHQPRSGGQAAWPRRRRGRPPRL